MSCRRRCPGLPETRVLAPALPISNWVTSGQSFHPSGGFLAHKIRVLEEAISVVPSSSVIHSKADMLGIQRVPVNCLLLTDWSLTSLLKSGPISDCPYLGGSVVLAVPSHLPGQVYGATTYLMGRAACRGRQCSKPASPAFRPLPVEPSIMATWGLTPGKM